MFTVLNQDKSKRKKKGMGLEAATKIKERPKDNFKIGSNIIATQEKPSCNQRKFKVLAEGGQHPLTKKALRIPAELNLIPANSEFRSLLQKDPKPKGFGRKLQ